MSLFDQELSFQEAITIDSLLDSGGISPEMFLMTDAGQSFFPDKDTSDTVMKHLDSQPPNNTNAHETTNEEPQNIKNIPEKKNPKRQYIKLPDATIRKRHSYKPKQSEAKGHNESK